MHEKIQKLLAGESDNHLMPFFWQHGEDEATLREYMGVIEGAGCRAVCVESRPHPDFCGPKWWQDMDVILDEARKRNMKVWILDDSHFPTGFANGAVKDAPLELHRQSLCTAVIPLQGEAGEVTLELEGLIPPVYEPKNLIAKYMSASLANAPRYHDDKILALNAVSKSGEAISIPYDGQMSLTWQKPAGDWTVYVIALTRDMGSHRDYMNMLDPSSCRLLLDAVYEPHWQHYQADFGSTIAGFFSDEPELGNGHMYWMENVLGTEQDLPFSARMPAELERRLGADWVSRIHMLWSNDCNPAETARVRTAYMDAVTLLVRESFSRQVGDWCRAHGVKYIGHLIEDNNAHARTGSSLGHYFRGLDGQDMAGIDDIGGQVMPQAEDLTEGAMIGQTRDGEFYHYLLGSLGASAAAIEPAKHGDSMCEIFGAYGWSEGVRLEKYLIDHFMVRGINNFVPHAFSPAPFPDSDCPPHFYAHGHNPQYRHFGALMNYANRVTTLISGGRKMSQVGVLYHGEAEWAGKAMLSQKITRRLYESQIDFDLIPCDVFSDPAHYNARFDGGLRVNTQHYKALFVPASEYLPSAALDQMASLITEGFPIYFVEHAPLGRSDSSDPLPESVSKAQVIQLKDVVTAAIGVGSGEMIFTPANTALRALHYVGDEELFLFVNESAEVYRGTVELPWNGPCFRYDAWLNKAYPVELKNRKCKVTIEPLKSLILITGKPEFELSDPKELNQDAAELTHWTRSICESIAYPAFSGAEEVTLPDHLAEEQPTFSGFVRYETTITVSDDESAQLEITDAYEGVEVFVNGASLGIQIAPPFRYDLSGYLNSGENRLTIEVATTLERWSAVLSKDDPRAALVGGFKEPTVPSGINGTVRLYHQ